MVVWGWMRGWEGEWEGGLLLSVSKSGGEHELNFFFLVRFSWKSTETHITRNPHSVLLRCTAPNAGVLCCFFFYIFYVIPYTLSQPSPTFPRNPAQASGAEGGSPPFVPFLLL